MEPAERKEISKEARDMMKLITDKKIKKPAPKPKGK